MRSSKEMSGLPTSLLERTTAMKRGIAFLPRGRWQRSADSSRERNDSPGSTGRLCTRRSSAGDDDMQKSEVLVMRTAAAVLKIIQERGKRRLPLEDIYRQLYNPTLYLRAYAKLYPNKGAMTPGTTMETVDAMTMAKIYQIIDDLRHERYRWTPVRRVYIAKKNGKLRALGLPSWSDKLLQEVIRQLLQAYYEEQFSDHSHGFRPDRGCHTALCTIKQTWNGTRWFIEGDIKACFDRIDHTVLLSILTEKLHDNRFLRLIRHLLQAGYLEEWQYHQTLSGCPQGGVVSPLLSNIYGRLFGRMGTVASMQP